MLSIRNPDLALINASALALVPLAVFAPSLGALRLLLGLPFLLFFPGYCLLAVLFPEKGRPAAVERLVFAFALSIALVPMAGLALNYSPWGMRMAPVLVSLTLLMTLLSAIAFFRRRGMPTEQAFAALITVHPRALLRSPGN